MTSNLYSFVAAGFQRVFVGGGRVDSGCVVGVVAVLLICAGARADDRVRAAGERVHRHRPSSVAVRRIGERLVADAEVLRVAQLVLDQESDSFFDDLTSVRAAVESRLSGASDETRRKYETVVGAEANGALLEAVHEASIASLRRISRRFYLTQAGYSACERLVVLWLDAGEYSLAARLGNVILAESAHRKRITPQFRKLVRGLNVAVGADLSVAAREGEANPLTAFEQRFWKHRELLSPLDAGWMVHGGNATGGRIVAGSPIVPLAEWKTDFFRNQSSRSIQDFLRDWEGSRKELDEPCCPASYPVVVDRSVIFRDSAGLRSVDATTGMTLWSFPCSYLPIRSEGRRWAVVRSRSFATVGVPAGSNAFGENSLMGVISSDGELVFAIDTSTTPDLEDDPADSMAPVHPFRNRLVAVHARNGVRAGKLAWVQEGQVPDRLKKPSAPNRFTFLGPPLPGASELLCLTEHDVEVHLTALDPKSGAVIWSQPLCSIEKTELADPERHELACLPARANGIVVCPTNSGLLVAVDQARMNLLWAAFVDDLPDPKRAQFRGAIRPPASGYSGYASQVMISSGCVLYVPLHSSQFHCLELDTGKILWSAPRNGAEFIGAVADGRVLVVGRHGCRSLAMRDGRELWEVTTGMPAGRGVAIGNRYAMPLDSGRLAFVDLATGHDHGTKALRSDIPLGHLVADRNRVYSLGSRGLAALPQVDHVLRNINAAAPNETAALQHEIALAEVAMVQGNLADAERRLRSILARDLLAVDRERSRRELRELLFQKIEDQPGADAADYVLLDRLLESPEDQFRFLIAASTPRGQAAGGVTDERVADRVYELPSRLTGTLPGEEEWKISPSVWCRLQLKEPRTEGYGGRLQQLRDLRTPRLREDAEVEEIERYVRVFNGDPHVVSARSMLASRCATAGSVQQSEMLWLRNTNDGDPRVGAEAAKRLMELWEENGFITDAAAQLEVMTTTFAEVSLPGGLTGREFVRQQRDDQPAKQAWRQSREPRWPVEQVQIHQTAVRPDFAQPLVPMRAADGESVRFQSDRLGTTPQGRTARYNWQPIEFAMTPTEFEDRTVLTIFDQRTKSRLGFLTVPLVNRFPGVDKVVTSGHLIPLGVPGGIMGISTLQLGDAEPVWKQFPADLNGRRSPVNPGPSGADFASFSWRNWIYVVDPLDGTLLWQRKISVSSQELHANFRLELIGDRQAIGVQRISDVGDGVNQISFEVFETATGRRVSTVRSGFISGQWRGSYGRHVVGIVDSPGGRRLQIRDLLKESAEINEPISDNRQPVFLPGGELIYVGMGGEVRIFDVGRCRKKLSVQLEPGEVQQIRALQVFSDRSRYFLNLRRHAPTATTTHSNQPISNQHVAGLPIGDDLYAFDRATGELLWKRAVPYRTLLQFPDCQLPFLVMLSQVNDRVNSALQSMTIEVIDSSSGVTIGYRDHLKFDQLIHAQYDGELGCIQLHGQVSDIELKFGPTAAMFDARR